MEPSTDTRAADHVRRIVAVAIIAAIGTFVLYTAYRAILSAAVNDDFPEALAIKVELLPLTFPLHMVTGGLALILLPLTIALRRRPRWHRPLGRIAAADVAVAGVTAYPVAWVAPVTFWSAMGFSAQATVWLVLLALGVGAIRRRRVAAHWRYMLLMTATAFGAVFFRVFLASWALWGSFRWYETFYVCGSWVAWMLPLGVTAAVLAARRRRVTSGDAARSARA